jgi:plastocyanin
MKLKIRREKQMTIKKASIAGLAGSILVAMVMFAGSPSVRANTDQPSAEVTIDNFTFGPQTITVPVGATVTWTNKDDIPHASASTEGVFKSKVLDTDEKFSYKFTKAGTYPYYCTIHPKMTGQVVVK